MNNSALFTLLVIIYATIVVTPVNAQNELVYVAVEPCRIVDTREGGGVITAGSFRNFRVTGTAGELSVQGGKNNCLNPKSVTSQKPLAISAYVIAVPASGSGSGVLTAYPSDQPPPPVGTGSTVNFSAQQIIGNTTIITLCSPAGSCPSGGEFAILARNTNQHVVVDVQGYFYPTEGGGVYVKSNGQNIGMAVGGIGAGPHKEFSVVNSKEYFFKVTTQGVIVTNYYVQYESNDCTGQGYIFYDEAVPTPTGIVFTRYDTSTVSYIARGTQPVLIQVGSNYNGYCNIDYGQEMYALPMLQNDPAITGVQNNYATPITVGF